MCLRPVALRQHEQRPTERVRAQRAMLALSVVRVAAYSAGGSSALDRAVVVDGCGVVRECVDALVGHVEFPPDGTATWWLLLFY
jgi:hypothetical protein